MKPGPKKRHLNPRRTGAAALVLLATALLALAVASALGQTVQAGNLIVEIEGQVSPQKLPKKAPAPITLTVSGAVKTADGTHVPALKTLSEKLVRQCKVKGN